LRRRLAVFSLALSLVVGETVLAAGPSPLAMLKQKNDELVRLLRQTDHAGAKATREQRVALEQATAALIDYDSFARKSLAEHWGSLKRRDEFLAVFRKMLANRYLQQLRASLDCDVVYEGEAIESAGQATVRTLVKERSKRTAIDTEVVYGMHQVGGAWLIQDIITDEVSLVRNYKTQFHKIISEQGADKLIEKMKAKLEP
jgi:phospholipid transport system substrate-binding protein